MKETITITNNHFEFLHFMKAKYPLYNQSNIFFRDLHFGVKEFLEMKNQKISYTKSELVTKEVALFYEKQKVFKKVSQRSWVLLYPEFTLKKSKV